MSSSVKDPNALHDDLNMSSVTHDGAATITIPIRVASPGTEDADVTSSSFNAALGIHPNYVDEQALSHRPSASTQPSLPVEASDFRRLPGNDKAARRKAHAKTTQFTPSGHDASSSRGPSQGMGQSKSIWSTLRGYLGMEGGEEGANDQSDPFGGPGTSSKGGNGGNGKNRGGPTSPRGNQGGIGGRRGESNSSSYSGSGHPPQSPLVTHSANSATTLSSTHPHLAFYIHPYDTSGNSSSNPLPRGLRGPSSEALASSGASGAQGNMNGGNTSGLGIPVSLETSSGTPSKPVQRLYASTHVKAVVLSLWDFSSGPRVEQLWAATPWETETTPTDLSAFPSHMHPDGLGDAGLSGGTSSQRRSESLRGSGTQELGGIYSDSSSRPSSTKLQPFRRTGTGIIDGSIMSPPTSEKRPMKRRKSNEELVSSSFSENDPNSLSEAIVSASTQLSDSNQTSSVDIQSRTLTVEEANSMIAPSTKLTKHGPQKRTRSGSMGPLASQTPSSSSSPASRAPGMPAKMQTFNGKFKDLSSLTAAAQGVGSSLSGRTPSLELGRVSSMSPTNYEDSDMVIGSPNESDSLALVIEDYVALKPSQNANRTNAKLKNMPRVASAHPKFQKRALGSVQPPNETSTSGSDSIATTTTSLDTSADGLTTSSELSPEGGSLDNTEADARQTDKNLLSSDQDDKDENDVDGDEEEEEEGDYESVLEKDEYSSEDTWSSSSSDAWDSSSDEGDDGSDGGGYGNGGGYGEEGHGEEGLMKEVSPFESGDVEKMAAHVAKYTLGSDLVELASNPIYGGGSGVGGGADKQSGIMMDPWGITTPSGYSEPVGSTPGGAFGVGGAAQSASSSSMPGSAIPSHPMGSTMANIFGGGGAGDDDFGSFFGGGDGGSRGGGSGVGGMSPPPPGGFNNTPSSVDGSSLSGGGSSDPYHQKSSGEDDNDAVNKLGVEHKLHVFDRGSYFTLAATFTAPYNVKISSSGGGGNALGGLADSTASLASSSSVLGGGGPAFSADATKFSMTLLLHKSSYTAFQTHYAALIDRLNHWVVLYVYLCQLRPQQALPLLHKEVVRTVHQINRLISVEGIPMPSLKHTLFSPASRADGISHSSFSGSQSSGRAGRSGGNASSSSSGGIPPSSPSPRGGGGPPSHLSPPSSRTNSTTTLPSMDFTSGDEVGGHGGHGGGHYSSDFSPNASITDFGSFMSEAKPESGKLSKSRSEGHGGLASSSPASPFGDPDFGELLLHTPASNAHPPHSSSPPPPTDPSPSPASTTGNQGGTSSSSSSSSESEKPHKKTQDFLALILTSHFQTHQRTVIMGDDVEMVNTFVASIALFLSPEDRARARYATYHNVPVHLGGQMTNPRRTPQAPASSAGMGGGNPHGAGASGTSGNFPSTGAGNPRGMARSTSGNAVNAPPASSYIPSTSSSSLAPNQPRGGGGVSGGTSSGAGNASGTRMRRSSSSTHMSDHLPASTATLASNTAAESIYPSHQQQQHNHLSSANSMAGNYHPHSLQQLHQNYFQDGFIPDLALQGLHGNAKMIKNSSFIQAMTPVTLVDLNRRLVTQTHPFHQFRLLRCEYHQALLYKLLRIRKSNLWSTQETLFQSVKDPSSIIRRLVFESMRLPEALILPYITIGLRNLMARTYILVKYVEGLENAHNNQHPHHRHYPLPGQQGAGNQPYHGQGGGGGGGGSGGGGGFSSTSFGTSSASSRPSNAKDHLSTGGHYSPSSSAPRTGETPSMSKNMASPAASSALTPQPSNAYYSTGPALPAHSDPYADMHFKDSHASGGYRTSNTASGSTTTATSNSFAHGDFSLASSHAPGTSDASHQHTGNAQIEQPVIPVNGNSLTSIFASPPPNLFYHHHHHLYQHNHSSVGYPHQPYHPSHPNAHKGGVPGRAGFGGGFGQGVSPGSTLGSNGPSGPVGGMSYSPQPGMTLGELRSNPSVLKRVRHDLDLDEPCFTVLLGIAELIKPGIFRALFGDPMSQEKKWIELFEGL